MEDLFKDIANINGVLDIVLLSGEGKVVYNSATENQPGISQRYAHWRKLIDTINQAREADFVFESGRLYLRRAENGYLVVAMQSAASIAMVKLNCDIVLPQLKHQKSSKGIKGFFKR